MNNEIMNNETMNNETMNNETMNNETMNNETVPANIMKNPYVGPRTFTREDRVRFFGREQEARDLLSRVISERLVLFYAQSGAGKSSLINTRLVPQLQAASFAVLPIGRVSGALATGMSTVDNIFVFNLLLSLDQSEGHPNRFNQMTLTDFLAKLTTPDGEHYYYDETAEDTSNTDESEQPPHVLIIDQFEEIATTHLASWQDREGFFRQLDQAMANDPLLWVVLTLREDYVAALDPYAHLLPGKLRTRFYMQRMGYEAALEAVKKPAEQAGRPFAPDVAEMLVNNLRQIRIHGQRKTYPGQFVEPVQLQVVCYQLWENLLGRPQTEITAHDLQELGNVDATLAQFYELAKVVKQTKESERHVRNWFDHRLITESDTRGIVHHGSRKTEGLNNETVKLLANQFLLHAEIRAGGVWYELTHDRFVAPIQRSNAEWRAAMLKKWGRIGAGIAVLLIILTLFAMEGIQRFRVNSAIQQAEAEAAAAQIQATQAIQQAEANAGTAQIQATQAIQQAEANAGTAQIQATQAIQQAEAGAAAIQATSTIEAAAVEATSTAAARRARERPLKPGLSISGSEARGGTGTLGYFVVDDLGQIHILSDADVLGRAESESGQADIVLQPGASDGGQNPDDIVGRVTHALPITGTMVSVANMTGLAKLESGIEIEPSLTIPGIGQIQGVRDPAVGMTVRKFGRTTGLTTGTIQAVAQNVEILISQDERVQLLDTTISVSMKSSGGDSGALIVDEEGYAIGILIAGSSTATLIAPIQVVLDTFGVELLLPKTEEQIVEPPETVPDGENRYIYGLHDRGGEHLMIVDGKAKGWVVVSEAIGADPGDVRGSDYADLADKGLGVIVVLVHAYGSDGTLPLVERCPDFAQRAANYVKNSSGAHIWVIGNEMNWEANWPRLSGGNEGQPITPRLYAECYSRVRQAIHALPGHTDDQVVVGAIAPWSPQMSYEADPLGAYSENKLSGAPNNYPFNSFFGDWNKYLQDILLTIGPGNVDGIAIHAYTHGTNPNLVFSDDKLGPPFEKYNYHFRTYQDQMNAIPSDFRHLPVYLTEMDEDDPWDDTNSGWVKNAYQEINDWNEANNQQIRAAVLYRWPTFDQWSIGGKINVQQDFQEAMAQNYQWISSPVLDKEPTPTPTDTPSPTATPTPRPASADTPVPPTDTPTPTPTPTNTPTPAPIFPPAGQIIFTSNRSSDPRVGYLYVMNGDGSDVRQLSRDLGSEPSYSKIANKIVFSRPVLNEGVSLYTITSDGQREVSIDNRYWNNWEPTWSPDGQQVAFTSSRANLDWEIYSMNIDGSDLGLLKCDNIEDQDWLEWLKFAPAWSPDGQRIAFVVQSKERDQYEGQADIWMMDADGANCQPLTDNEESQRTAIDKAPDWSPDNQRLVFVSNRDGDFEMYIMDADGGNRRKVTKAPPHVNYPDWSSDGNWLTFSVSTKREDRRPDAIYVMTVEGDYLTNISDGSGEDWYSIWLPE
ncbi:DPP IV N-terminal domain-containing protein [Chloroflexota bacterium]